MTLQEEGYVWTAEQLSYCPLIHKGPFQIKMYSYLSTFAKIEDIYMRLKDSLKHSNLM